MAVSFFTDTKRSAIFLRSIDIFSLLISLDPPQTEIDALSNPFAIALLTSCFVIRPSFPDATT